MAKRDVFIAACAAGLDRHVCIDFGEHATNPHAIAARANILIRLLADSYAYPELGRFLRASITCPTKERLLCNLKVKVKTHKSPGEMTLRRPRIYFEIYLDSST